MSPTFDTEARFVRDLRRLTRAQRDDFDRAWPRLVEALREHSATFPPALRIHRVQGHEGVWELSWAADGRATFSYGPERRPGEPHVIWRRIGDHSVLLDP